MDGLLLVIKPPGMTSFGVVAYLRGVFKIKKIGHAGTLDPAAGGLLPVCIGKATKSIDWFQNFHKSYRAEMVLGVVTDTQDAEGNIIEENEVTVDNSAILDTLNSFIGEYAQIPPMHSAIKVNGQKLYKLARQGIEVQRKARVVEISNISGVEIKQDSNNNTIVRFSVDCSKGTYIRTLCHDIGRRLGYGAHMSFLIRTRVGPFSLTDGITLEEIKKQKEEGTLSSILRPVDILFQNYEALYISEKSLKKFLNGAFVELCKSSFRVPETVRVYSNNGFFIGLGKVFTKGDRKVLKAEKLFVSNNFVIS